MRLLAPAIVLYCQVGLIPLMELLLQNGARAGWADAAGRQPLHYAVLAGRTEAAKLLVSAACHTYPGAHQSLAAHRSAGCHTYSARRAEVYCTYC